MRPPQYHSDSSSEEESDDGSSVSSSADNGMQHEVEGSVDMNRIDAEDTGQSCWSAVWRVAAAVCSAVWKILTELWYCLVLREEAPLSRFQRAADDILQRHFTPDPPNSLRNLMNPHRQGRAVVFVGCRLGEETIYHTAVEANVGDLERIGNAAKQNIRAALQKADIPREAMLEINIARFWERWPGGPTEGEDKLGFYGRAIRRPVFLDGVSDLDRLSSKYSNPAKLALRSKLQEVFLPRRYANTEALERKGQ